MNTFGIGGSLFAPGWEPLRLDPWMERLQEEGVGLLEVSLSRPRSVDPKSVRDFARRWGVSLFFAVHLPPALDVAERPEDGLDFLEPAFRLAAEAGSFGFGGICPAGRMSTGREIDGWCRFLERAAKLARPHGQKLGLQPVNRYETRLVNRASEAVGMVERIGAENIFLHLDTFHMALEEESFSSAFAAAEPFLGYCGLSEANRGRPGRGTLDWPAVFKALADIGYSGPLTLQCPLFAEGELGAHPALPHALNERPEAVLEEGLPFLREQAGKVGLTLGKG